MQKFFNQKFLFLILFLLPFIFFHQTLNSNIITLGDFSGSDLLDFHLPFKYILHERFMEKSLPLWESRLALGFPLLAEGQSGIFYPINIILSLLPPASAINGSIIIVFLITSLAVYYYFRLINFSYTASLFGSISFAFSAFFITRAKHINMINVASLFPILLVLSTLYFKTGKIRYVLLTGLVITFMIFSGHPQMTFYSLIVFVLYIIFESVKTYFTREDRSVFPAALFYLFTALTIAVGLSAVQTLPSIELLSLSERPAFTEGTITAYPFHPKNLILLFSPFYFGNPADGTYRENIRTAGIFWENASYFGFIPILFALFWLPQLLKKKQRDMYSLFYLFLGVFSLLLMLGPFTPFFLMLTQFIPLLNLFRFPTRFNLFFIFSLVFIATKTYEYIIQKIPEQYRNSAKTGILIILIIDLFVFASFYIGYLPQTEVMKTPKIAKQIPPSKDLFRIYNLTEYGESPYRILGWKNKPETLTAIREAIPPNNNVMYNLSSFNDREWFEGGISIKRRNRIENFILKENENTALTGKILGLFNVKYIIDFKESVGIEIEKIKDFDLGKNFGAKLNLFENHQAMPRFFYVPEQEILDSEDEVFKRLTDINFQPPKTVLLEKKPNKILPQFSGILEEFQKKNKLKLIAYQPENVIIQTDLKNNGFLTLSDMFYPGWKVKVDGKDQELLIADYIIRTVELSPGQHTVEFYYDPLSFKIGAIISITTTLCLVIYFLYKIIHLLI